MERSFKQEIAALRLGDGAVFRGEGILAVTKALLQSGVSYVGGYQGAPVSHLLDVMVEAEDLMAELGVHVEMCTNEASAAAMLGASINYPLRGAVTWKSIVGTNVAADALSNLASPGVIGGALIILGEDYGEGASVIQERSYAFAMKSSIWLLDPRPDLATIVRCVEKGFELSEASHAPVMLELRIRACHVTGEFYARDNRPGRYSGRNRLPGPVRFDYARLAHPPVTFVQERKKVEERLPAARAFILTERLNETLSGDLAEVGLIVMGGLTNSVLRALARLDLAGYDGASRVPVLVLNVVYPLVPEEIRAFCAGKRAVLIVEEGHPAYIEEAVQAELRRAESGTRVFGKGPLPAAGEYTADVLLRGIAAFLGEARPAGLDTGALAQRVEALLARRNAAAAALGELPPRPPTFCTGCPERPVFAALKLAQRELGPTHISADIGCHSFATFAPFSFGNSILGYGMSLASAAAVGPNLDRRPIAVMGDGGFWHNGLITGVVSSRFNQADGVLIVMQNGYASATGQQWLPSSPTGRTGTAPGISIERTLRALGVGWLRTVRSYSVATMVKTLKEAMRTTEKGLKVIIADGECQLARQRRLRAEEAQKLQRGARVVRTRFGVDEAICTGDHSCIRLSGCPSLTVKDNPDPLRTDPVATVVESCVGCGLCGEVAHAAVLCPSFYRAELIRNPTRWDVIAHRLRMAVIGWLGGSASATASGAVEAGPTPATEAAASVSAMSRQRGSAQPDLPAATAAAGPGSPVPRPLTVLIAALGGEGGGVLTDWIVAAAAECGFPVQSTSIPGVAQRTGATTYYLELLPVPRHALSERRPVLALTPGIGDIDVFLASELLEAARAAASGFITADRTRVIASTSRAYAMQEKTAMGDGRLHSERLIGAVTHHAREAVLFDMTALAKECGSFVNAVMLGALAGRGALPIPAAAFEAAIRADGKAVESNLRGFRAGLAAAQGQGRPQTAPLGHRIEAGMEGAALEGRIAAAPALAQAVMREGVRRLTAYQDSAYAALYLDRLTPIADAEAAAGGDGSLLRETARHLALRMAFEDVIRVAQVKSDPARLARIRAELGAGAGEPYRIVEFLKPGIEEMCSLLPPRLARRILAAAERRGLLARLHWGMEVPTTAVGGYLRLRLLAALRRLRRYSHRFAEEQAQIDSWLALVRGAATRSLALAREVAECARLIKGYGDTHKRGLGNYRRIEAEIIRPALAGTMPPAFAADAVASARTAALADPEGETLTRCLAEIARSLDCRIAAE